MASIQINRRKLLGTGGASLALLGTGLLASRPAFSQSAAYYMPDAVRDWSDAPRLTFGETAAVSDFEALAEVSSFHAPGDTRTPYTLLGRVFDRTLILILMLRRGVDKLVEQQRIACAVARRAEKAGLKSGHAVRAWFDHGCGAHAPAKKCTNPRRVDVTFA